jgi:2-haloacid dehalogenase
VKDTLIDIDSLAGLFGEWFGDERVLRERFAQLVMYSMTATLMETYVNFAELPQGVLRMLDDS